MRGLPQITRGQNQYICNFGAVRTGLFQLENVGLLDIELQSKLRHGSYHARSMFIKSRGGVETPVSCSVGSDFRSRPRDRLY
jgi:hypothetical protein